MKLRVDINLDNLGPDVGQEIARLLRLVTEIYKSYTAEELAGAQGVPLLDIEGNIVGGTRIVSDVTVYPKPLHMG